LIYLDNNATTEPLQEVQAAMLEFLQLKWGNPSSAHAFGADAKAGMDRARLQVANLVGADPNSLIFTASATEANNNAILSALRSNPGKRRIVTVATEHSSVITMVRAQESTGYDLVLVPPIACGVVDMKSLREAINDDTAVVSVMWANNETGVINPIEEIAEICRHRGIPFHCDAVQAAGKLPINLQRLELDYLSLSSHKIHGPKGVGALVIAPTSRFTPMLLGGHQENGRRGGTENVPAIVGFGRAATLAATEMNARATNVRTLRDRLEGMILSQIPGTVINGQGTDRLSNTTNIGFPGADSDTLVSLLDQNGVCVSSGSACLSDTVAPSHVILAMTGSYKSASEAIRFSLSHLNTLAEIDKAVEVLKKTVAALP
jgi:cysteine desulfurase